MRTLLLHRFTHDVSAVLGSRHPVRSHHHHNLIRKLRHHSHHRASRLGLDASVGGDSYADSRCVHLISPEGGAVTIVVKLQPPSHEGLFVN